MRQACIPNGDAREHKCSYGDYNRAASIYSVGGNKVLFHMTSVSVKVNRS